jgi:hypothetical protein
MAGVAPRGWTSNRDAHGSHLRRGNAGKPKDEHPVWLVITFAIVASITAGYLIGALAPRRGWPGPGADIVLGAAVGVLVGFGCAALVSDDASVDEYVSILLIELLSPYGILLLLRAGMHRLVRPPRP